MRARLQFVVLLAIVVLTGWADSDYLSAYDALQKRETIIKRFKIRWRYIETIWEGPMDITLMMESVERAGAYIPEELKRKQKEAYSREHLCQHEAEMVLWRDSDSLLLKAAESWCSSPDRPGDFTVGTQKFYIYFDSTYAVYFPEDTDAEPILISPHTAPAVVNHVSLTQFVWPIDFGFLANYNILNVLDLHKKGAWRVVKKSGDVIILEAMLPANNPYSNYPMRWRVALSKSKGFAPVWAELYEERPQSGLKDGLPNEAVLEVRVSQWGKQHGLWFPRELSRIYRISKVTRKSYRLFLKDFTIYSESLQLPSVDKGKVIDYRVSYRKDIPMVELPENDHVDYDWTGRVPDLSELKVLKADTKKQISSFSIVSYLMWLPPLVLILIGSVWILRTMRWRQG